MKLIINKDRTTVAVGTWGTVNENDYEILDFEFPAELDEYNKRIVYYLGNERVWDTIVNNKAYITNAITTKGDVKAYVWCTKENTEREADTDFRTMLFEMNFYENENADGIVPTEEQVDGFNTMLTAMNAKIDEVDALEQTIETAEAERQEAEATRVLNENTRQSNESTRQTNEQTRQTQEADRERRTDEAIGNIEDKTAEYNANAEAKTTAFNNNATQKTNEFNSNYTQKVNDFNSNATSKTNDFNSNASSKTTTFNDNAASKTNTFNSNASSKTTDFNTNAENKTSAFNTNASDKTTAFDNNASSKTTTFNENATSKTSTFNDNATQKTTDFNNNAQAKIDEYDAHIVDYQAQIDDLQNEVEELSENMPWAETEQATEIDITDAAKYSKNHMKVFGNTEQATNIIIYKCDGTETGDYYFIYDNVNYQFTMPTISANDILVFNTDTLKLYLSDTEITTTTDNTGTLITMQNTPNPDYPQDIHVVTGNNTIHTGIYNDTSANFLTGAYDNLSNKSRARYTNSIIPIGTKITVNVNIDLTKYKWSVYESNSPLPVQNQISVGAGWITSTQSFTYTTGHQYVNLNVAKLDNSNFSDEEILQFNVNFTADYNKDYPLNLGSLELCKIGNYQDYLYKENGNWYKYGAVTKRIFTENDNFTEGTFGTNSYQVGMGTVKKATQGTTNEVLVISNAFRGVDFNVRTSSGDNVIYAEQERTKIYIRNTTFSTLSDFKAYLQNNNLVSYYVRNTPTSTQITDETLISQLEAIYNHLALVKGTNHITITPSDLEPYVTLNYMQDLPSKLDNLDSRLSLLE